MKLSWKEKEQNRMSCGTSSSGGTDEVPATQGRLGSWILQETHLGILSVFGEGEQLSAQLAYCLHDSNTCHNATVRTQGNFTISLLQSL